MKWLVRIFALLLILSILFALAVQFLFPNDATIMRSKIVNAPVATVFNQVNHLQNWEKWSAWAEMDEDEKYTYSDPEAKGKGAWYEWDGKKMGQGKLTIMDSQQNASIKTELNFGDMGKGEGSWTFEAIGPEQTKISWSFFTEAQGFFGKMFLPMMDSQLGPSLEKGLNNLNDASLQAYVDDKKGAARKKVMELRKKQALQLKNRQ